MVTRRAAIILTVIAITTASGCAHRASTRPALDNHRQPCRNPTEPRYATPNPHEYPVRQTVPTSVMLFDRFAQLLPAQAFATRSDWPSAFGRVEGTEITYYREWYTDYFGNSSGHGDLGRVRRVFESYRVGSQYR